MNDIVSNKIKDLMNELLENYDEEVIAYQVALEVIAILDTRKVTND